MLSFANYLLSWVVFTYSATFLAKILTYLTVGLTSIFLLAAEFGVVCMIKPRKLSNLLFIHAYWFLGSGQGPKRLVQLKAIVSMRLAE